MMTNWDAGAEENNKKIRDFTGDPRVTRVCKIAKNRMVCTCDEKTRHRALPKSGSRVVTLHRELPKKPWIDGVKQDLEKSGMYRIGKKKCIIRKSGKRCG